MEFLTTPSFDKEFKKLFKKYKSLDGDLKIFQKLLLKNIQLFITRSTNHHSIINVNQLRTIFVLKSRLQCRALKRSSLRIVYIYSKDKDKILFVEIYFKGNKEVEDRWRWKRALKGFRKFKIH